jgi:hypothetical protein
MAAPKKLKVFRTPIGFHDAYVAAPSQKAAMEAWGSDKDLFSRGEAELVTDPSLTAQPLASPGVVIKRLRGTAEEHMAALPEDAPAEKPTRRKEPAAEKRQAPRPSRAALEAAERALAEAAERQAEELRALAEREAELARERRALARAQADEMERLGSERDKAAAAYEEAVRRWRS